jgi:hypothetical protein
VYFSTFTQAGFSGSTEWENRIAVSHFDFGTMGGETIVVSFIATPNTSDSTGLGLFSANQGIWTVRADLFGSFGHVYRPIPVLQVGDSLGSTGETVASFAVYDQLANTVVEQANGDHHVAFWLSTASKRQMILRGSYIQQFGASGGPTTPCCLSGTLGALVSAGGKNYVLSNDHIFGNPSSPKKNKAKLGDPIVEPGLFDHNCRNPHKVAKFYRAPRVSTNVDAALASIINGEINTTAQIYNVGIPARMPIKAAVGMRVAKQGRSSGLTCGTVTMAKVITPDEKYPLCKPTFSLKFHDQVEIQSNDPGYPFSLAGDSGSLIIAYDTARPVALVFAKDPAHQEVVYGNPISTVVKQLSKVVGQNVALVGSKTHQVAGCHFTGREIILSAAAMERADEVKKKHETQLMQDPAVVGVGIGAADENPAQAVIVVMMEIGKEYRPIPPTIEGVHTKIVFRSKTIVPLMEQSCSGTSTQGP